MTDELVDRFGDIPKSAMNLMRIAYIKSKAHQAYILEIKASRKDMRIKMYPKANIDTAGIPELIRSKGSKMRFTNGEIPYFTYYFDKDDIKNTDSYIASITGVVDEILLLKKEEH